LAGAPPFIVALDEVGLTQGCKPVVSETRREPSRTDCHLDLTVTRELT
jgi:hypothetical protein